MSEKILYLPARSRFGEGRAVTSACLSSLKDGLKKQRTLPLPKGVTFTQKILNRPLEKI
jgi:hypothetical protein